MIRSPLIVSLCCATLFSLPNRAESASETHEQGLEALKNKDFDLAIACFTSILREDPKNARAFVWRGVAYREQDDNQKALADFAEAIRIDSKHTDAYVQRGQLYFDVYNFPNALADFSEAIKIDPRCVGAYLNRATIYMLIAGHDKVISDCNEVLKLNPNCVAAYYKRGITYHREKGYSEAIADLTEYVRLQPNDRDGCFRLAWIFATAPDRDLRDGKKSLELARKACDQSKAEDRWHCEVLAAVHAECGDFDEAVRWQRKALAISYLSESARDQATERLQHYEAHMPYRELGSKPDVKFRRPSIFENQDLTYRGPKPFRIVQDRDGRLRFEEGWGGETNDSNDVNLTKSVTPRLDSHSQPEVFKKDRDDRSNDRFNARSIVVGIIVLVAIIRFFIFLFSSNSSREAQKKT